VSAETLEKHVIALTFDQDIAVLESNAAFMSRLHLSGFDLSSNKGDIITNGNTVEINIVGIEGELSFPPDFSGPALSLDYGAVRSIANNMPNDYESEVNVADGISPSLIAAAFIESNRFALYFNELVNFTEGGANAFFSKVSSAGLLEENTQITGASVDGNTVYVDLSMPIPTADFELEDLIVQAGAVLDLSDNACIEVLDESVENYLAPQHTSFTSFVNKDAATVTLEVYFDHNINMDTHCDSGIEIRDYLTDQIVGPLDPAPAGLIDVWDELGVDNFNLKKLSIDLAGNGLILEYGKQYYVTIPSTMFFSVYDYNDNCVYYPGINSKETWKFNVLNQ
jgi:hypothetical protein